MPTSGERSETETQNGYVGVEKWGVDKASWISKQGTQASHICRRS
jgi:hypothetical protein